MSATCMQFAIRKLIWIFLSFDFFGKSAGGGGGNFALKRNKYTRNIFSISALRAQKFKRMFLLS